MLLYSLLYIFNRNTTLAITSSTRLNSLIWKNKKNKKVKELNCRFEIFFTLSTPTTAANISECIYLHRGINHCRFEPWLSMENDSTMHKYSWCWTNTRWKYIILTYWDNAQWWLFVGWLVVMENINKKTKKKKQKKTGI